MRCGALTLNYATNARCCAKKSDRSLNPADMTTDTVKASVALLKAWRLQRKEKPRNEEENESCLSRKLSLFCRVRGRRGAEDLAEARREIRRMVEAYLVGNF